MKIKNKINLGTLLLFISISLQSYSQIKKQQKMNTTKNEKIGLLLTITAKKGKEQAVKDFLLGGLSLVNAELKTTSWFAFQIDKKHSESMILLKKKKVEKHI